MKIDKNTKYSWIKEEVKPNISLSNEILGIFGLSFVIALNLVIAWFLLFNN